MLLPKQWIITHSWWFILFFSLPECHALWASTFLGGEWTLKMNEIQIRSHFSDPTAQIQKHGYHFLFKDTSMVPSLVVTRVPTSRKQRVAWPPLVFRHQENSKLLGHLPSSEIQGNNCGCKTIQPPVVVGWGCNGTDNSVSCSEVESWIICHACLLCVGFLEHYEGASS